MKTFKDLKFTPHPIAKEINALRDIGGISKYGSERDYVWAKEKFDNKYGISVLRGTLFYSNGKTNYEVGILYNGHLNHIEEFESDVLGYLSEDEVTEVMIKLQNMSNIDPDIFE